MATVTIRTPLGQAILEGNENGLHSLQFLNCERLPDKFIPSELKATVEQLEAYFTGTLSAFNLKLNPIGTAFQHKVWNAVTEIPWGQQVSYLDLAIDLGNPKAVRAVAAAIGRNPLLIVTPCHRVIGSNGSLTGYAGGIGRKKWLLQHEQATVQASLFE